MAASNAAEAIRNMMRADSASPRRWVRISSTARLFIAASIAALWFAAQYSAIAVCSGVRVSAIWRTSARAELYSSEPTTGGGGERSSSSDVRQDGRAFEPARTGLVPVQGPGVVGARP